MFQKLTDKLDEFLKFGIPFYDCIVMKDGKCVYRHSNGYTDAAKTVTVTGKEKYNIYSCSKLMTCIAALQLWEKGMFSLDDKLSKYLPEFENMTVKKDGGAVPAKNPILIRNLFTMTAGFSYNLEYPQILLCRKDTNGECPTRELIRYLAKEPLEFEPGERWEYSLCHDILAALIEVLTGITFGEYVKKNIFDPLGMDDSTFLLPDDRLDEVINQYSYSAEKGVVERDKHIPYKLGSKYESGGAGCISTVDDYIKLLEAVRVGDVILKKETIDLMATNQLTEEQIKTYGWGYAYGYGLGQRCPNGGERTDFGWGGAAGAYYMINREKGITAYYGTHILGHGEYQGRRVEIIPIIEGIF